MKLLNKGMLNKTKGTVLQVDYDANGNLISKHQ